MTPQAFALQCAWLARNRRMLDLDTAALQMDASGRLPRRTGAITFDDGLASIFDLALPVLRRHRIPATVFLVTRTLIEEGQPVDWVDDPPALPLRTLTRDQVLEMRGDGVRFGSHSHAHRDLTTLGEAECERDLRDSRELLEDLIGGPVRHLAYPRGRHDERVRRAVARAGFTHGFTLPESKEPGGPLAIPRVGVYRGNGLLTLRVKASRPYLGLRTRLFPAVGRVIRGKRPER
jgi:peptidoglycan/xylan/chitin deacetylase (PgdA/CDA1 family)